MSLFTLHVKLFTEWESWICKFHVACGSQIWKDSYSQANRGNGQTGAAATRHWKKRWVV